MPPIGLLFPSLANMNRWEPVVSPITCCPRCRSREHLLEVVASFEVTRNPRYQRDVANTYCNIFVRDVCRALLAWLPDTVLAGAAWHELNANRLIDWLGHAGERYNWRMLATPVEAAICADRGEPVLATYRAAEGATGHLAMVIPSSLHRPAIAQAGATCGSDIPLTAGFGGLPVKYFGAP